MSGVHTWGFHCIGLSPFCADSMVGDVNLFLGKDQESDPERELVAEIDIMIAGITSVRQCMCNTMHACVRA